MRDYNVSLHTLTTAVDIQTGMSKFERGVCKLYHNAYLQAVGFLPPDEMADLLIHITTPEMLDLENNNYRFVANKKAFFEELVRLGLGDIPFIRIEKTGRLLTFKDFLNSINKKLRDMEDEQTRLEMWYGEII